MDPFKSKRGEKKEGSKMGGWVDGRVDLGLGKQGGKW
jgi:hypothetical protein